MSVYGFRSNYTRVLSIHPIRQCIANMGSCNIERGRFGGDKKVRRVGEKALRQLFESENEIESSSKMARENELSCHLNQQCIDAILYH